MGVAKFRVFGAALLLLLLAAAPLRAERVVMLGDSLTYAGRWSELLPEVEAINFGVSGETTRQIGLRLPRVAEAEPDKIFLLAGVNDFNAQRDGRPVDHIVNAHLALWAEAAARRPEAKLLIQSLLPVSEKRFPPSLNRDIREVNRRLKSEAEKRGLTFIDLYAQLADSSGQLPDELTYDGLHLTPAAYWLWAAAIRPYLQGSR